VLTTLKLYALLHDDSFCNRNLFPDNYFVSRADRDYTDSKLTRGGGVLTAVHSSFSSCKRRYDLELSYECVWLHIPILDAFNLLIGNHYFPLNMDIKVIENYFNLLENKLNSQNFRVVLLGDINVPGYDWVSGHMHYYTKLRGEVIQNTSCFLELSQYKLTIQSKNLLDLVFANCIDVAASNFYIDLVEPDTFHPSLFIDVSLFLPSYAQSRLSFSNYAYDDYALLCTFLSCYDWSCFYRESSVGTAVTQFNAAVSEASNFL
jgi:hypothetical protein